MAKITWRGGALVAPVPPAMITCGTMEQSNIITVAWTGILGTVPPKTYISVRPRRHSWGILRERGEFVINLTTEDLIFAADYCGMYTGAKIDKFDACRLTREEVPGFSCPMIAESPLSLACRVTEVVPMGSHDMFIADVVSVHVHESLIDESGKLHLENAHLAAFAHGEYFVLGKKLGTFGFSAVKKKKKQHTAQNPAPKQPPLTAVSAEGVPAPHPDTDRKTHGKPRRDSKPGTKPAHKKHSAPHKKTKKST